jgi:hypothetical protein
LAVAELTTDNFSALSISAKGLNQPAASGNRSYH